LEADLNDSGLYELVAKNEQGESQSRRVELTEEAILLSIQVIIHEVFNILKKNFKIPVHLYQDSDSTDGKKKKKKVVKKKKKSNEAVKEAKKPEITAFLRNLVSL